MKLLNMLFRSIRILIAQLCMKIYLRIGKDLGVDVDE